MNCFNPIPEKARKTKFYQLLKQYCGSSNTKLVGYYVAVAANDKFNKSFKRWYNLRHPNSEDLTFENVNSDTIVKEVIEYYNGQNPNGRATVMKEYKTNAVNYGSAGDRKFCISLVQNILQAEKFIHDNVKQDSKDFTYDKWCDTITEKWFKTVIKRVRESSGLKNEDLKRKFDSKRRADRYDYYINDVGLSKERAKTLSSYFEYLTIAREIFGENINVQDKNLLATLDEMLDYHENSDGVTVRDAYFEEVFNIPELRRLKINDDTFNQANDVKEASAEAVADGVNVDGGNTAFDLLIDETIENYNFHSGEYATFMMHLSANIQNYFNSIPVLRTTTRTAEGNYDYDTDNPVGLSYRMNAKQCASMLYGRAKLDGNIEQFIESIREIAEQVPRYEGFIKLYDDLKGYKKRTVLPTGEVTEEEIQPMPAFAEELFDTFAKTAMAKKELYIDKEGKLKARITNTMTSPKDSFRMQCRNSIKYSAIKTNFAEAKERYAKLVEQLNQITDNLNSGYVVVDIQNKITNPYNKQSLIYTADKRALLDKIHKSYKWYFPNITLSGILNYADNHQLDGKVDDIENMRTLIKLFNQVVDSAKETKDAYEERNKEAAKAKYDNEQLRSEMDFDPSITSDSFINIDEIYAKEYLQDSTEKAAFAVADELLKYSVIQTQYNSRNAAGNNSSDIINNSMLTYLKHLIEHEDNTPDNKLSPLHKFAKYKFQNNQYDGSNLLIEHKENGKIINLGLFRKITTYDDILEKTITTYEPTEYANELLHITLFNGTADHIKNKSALYANMSKGDYLVSALTSFQTSVYNGVEGHKVADYFLRTPSDAPKNFFLTLPKYSVDGLFVIDNQQELEDDINARLQQIVTTDKYKGGKEYKVVDKKTLLDLLTGEHLDRVYVSPKNYFQSDDITYVTVANGKTQIVLQGDLVTTPTKNNYIENIQVIGVLKTDKINGLDDNAKDLLHDYYYSQLKDNRIRLLNGEFVQRSINHNHPIFKQLYNVAKQEVTDAATAITTMFEKQQKIIEDGTTVTTFVKDGTLVWRDPFASSDDPDNMTEEIYHHAKGKKVFYKDSDGVIKLTGKVFSSDKFTKFSDIFEDEDGNKTYNVNVNYLEDLFADGVATEEDGKIHLLYGGHNTHLHLNADGTVDLTEAQRNYIEKQLDKFIKDYVNATYERVDEFSNIIRDDVAHSYDDIAEFILNYRLAYYACADILEGDSKCYKSFTDFLKRAKEVQGSGIPYSALDYTRELCSTRTLLPYSSLNSSTEIENLINAGKLHDAKAYNVFRGVTVKNTVRTSKETQTIIVDVLTKAIIRNYNASGISITEEEANVKAKDMMKGYEDVKTNDAQSYITLEEWIRRISMRGQLPKYLPLIERICDETKPLTINDINEFIQVQKNFYFDLYYDRITNHTRPRQIKNAEFVLVPRLVKGTQLEQVYNTMIEHGIDQLNTVETSKAGKSNILTLWDNDGNLSNEWFEAPIEKINNAVELYDYNFLYTQQETPQHANTENKAAIQLMKRVVDNIPQYLNGKEHPLWKTKQRFQSLYAQNIKESNANLLERLNIQYDSDGNFSISDKDGVIGLDANVFCDMLKDELLRQAQEDDMLNYATLNTSPVEELLTANGFGLDTRMPIIANNSVRAKFESIAQALFNNNITRQTLPGFHAAQITGIGWKNTENPTYNLIPSYNNTDLPKTLSYKEWKKLGRNDRGKYIPNNGVGVATDLKYHPAQYKNNKTGKRIDERDYLELSDKERKEYTLDGAATYCEVRIPKSMFNFDYYKRDKNGAELRLKTDEELLQELESAGLAEFVGYRIPTEGKQSIAVMKVVGFIDDSYGSTIVVPDDWVAQTGSDFDIDSVYSVIYNNRINQKTGKIEKVPYLTKFDYETYISYIRRRSKNKITKASNIKDLKHDLIEAINNRRQNEFLNAYLDDSVAYSELPENVQRIIKGAQQIKKAGLTKQEVSLKRIDNVVEALKKYIEDNPTNAEEIEQINDYIAIKERLRETISSEKYNKEKQKGIEEINTDTFKEIETRAKELNLPTYEQYLKLNDIEKNSRKARTNALISSMIDILKSDWSLEENLAQSNFREVVKARDQIINAHDKISKESRSPYDFMDQADNMEEAISGRSLKGISVAYDNTVSICNTCHPKLSGSHSVTVIYSLERTYKDEKGKTYTKKLNLNAIKRRFNEFETDEFGKEKLDDKGNPIIKKENVRELKDEEGNPTGKIAITHNRFGWSNDNRNIDEFLITTYSSQTTAHQLDVIKEGAIPNVNDYTFTVYKLFPAIGSDYNTAVAFMMQPGVTEIVKAYNRSKSIYASRYEDPIRRAIVDIANKLDSSIKTFVSAEKYLDNLLEERHITYKNVLDYDLLKDRIQGKEDILFDYLVIKKFRDLKTTSDKINAYTFVINPDKYGAKQSIFATNEIFNKIKDINEDDDPVFLKVNDAKGNSVTLLDAIFPNISKVYTDGIDEYIKNSDNEASLYKPLQYFMRYSTAPSIVINRRLFQTQHPNFRSIVNSIKSAMSGKNPVLSEETEDDFTSYIISYIHNSIDVISLPISYDFKTRNIKRTDGNPLRERIRVYGFFKPKTGENFRLKENDAWVEFKPLDLNHPTEGDVKRFLQFTPAQKVAYIQENFSDGLACNYLTVNLAVHSKYNRYNPDGQSIVFDEYKTNIAQAKEDFRQMFMNENPLLRLTAMDLIKYSYIVEGRSRARNTVGKIIHDDVLIESLEKNGTGIVDSLKYKWDLHINNRTAETTANLVENYVRSHPTMTEISQCSINNDDMTKYFSGRNKVGDMLMIFDSENTHDFIINKGIGYEEIGFNDNGEKVTKTKPNRYINVTSYKNKKTVQTLYRIEKGLTDTQFILVPLNLLEVNEFGVRSSNSNNNKHCFADFYQSFIDNWKSSNSGIGFKNYYTARVTDEKIAENTPTKLTLSGSTSKGNKNRLNAQDPKLYKVIDRIQEHFNGLNSTDLYIQDDYLNSVFAGATKIGPNGEYKDVEIDGVLYRITKAYNTQFKKYEQNDNPIAPEDKGLEQIINQIRSYNGVFKNIYCVRMMREIDADDTVNATLIEKPLLEVATDATQFVRNIALTGDANAARTYRTNTADGIEADTKSVKEHLETALINTKEYVKREVDILIKGNEVRPGFEMFWKDPDTGSYLTMTNPKVFAKMLDKQEGTLLHRSFLKLYLDALRLIEHFETCNYTKYIGKEKELQSHVDDILKEINYLKNNKIFKEAERLYVTEHLAKVSKNPNIQQNIISLLEGYHRTSFITAHINDLQDTSNSIIQIITKKTMADIRAKELYAEELIQKFDKKVKDIIEAANNAGMPINYDNIIDANGNWIDDFNENFGEDLANLYQAEKDAYKDYKASTGTDLEKSKLFEKYLEAKYNYDKFLLKNVNREIEDNYYHELLQIIDTMRYQNGKFFEIYVEYEMLEDRKLSLSRQSDADGGSPENIRKELDDITRRIRQLVSPMAVDDFDDSVYKGEFTKSTGDEAKDRLIKINSYAQAIALSDYLNNLDIIQNEYIKYDEKDSFKELLGRYLDIIEREEDRDPVTNTPRRSETDLANNETYTYAKNWIRENAIFKYGIDKREFNNLKFDKALYWLNKYYSGEIKETDPDFKWVVASASRYFKGMKGSKSNPNAAYKEIAKLKNARGVDGVIDARRFTKEELELVRAEDLERIGVTEDNEGSERGIIHNGNDDVIYKKSFWKKMKVDGLTNPRYKQIVRRINSILRKAYNIETKTLRTAFRLSENDLEELLKQTLILKYNLSDEEVGSLSGLELLNFVNNINDEDTNPIKKHIGTSKENAKEVARFIKKNVKFELNEKDKEVFDVNKAHAESRGDSYFTLWKLVNEELDEESGEYIPNHLFWGSIIAKDETYIDKHKTAAIKVVNYSYNNINTKYYEEEQSRMIRKYGRNSAEYKEWYNLNHIYNPNTHTFEPLSCWTMHSINANLKGDWIPTYRMSTKSVRDEHRNKYYREGLGFEHNYKRISERDDSFAANKANFKTRRIKTSDSNFIDYTRPDGTYDRISNVTEYERQLKDLFQSTLAPLAKTKQAKDYLTKAAPVMAKEDGNDTTWLTEIAKTFGLVDSNRKIYWDGNSDIGYNTDFVPPMPMMQQLTNKSTIHEPIRDKYNSDSEYEKALKDYEEHKAEYDKKNKEIHQSLINKDWPTVIKEFMRQAAHYNAIQDNKYQLYFGQQLLKDIKVYETRSDKHSKLRKKGVLSNENEPIYKKSVDKHLQEQYDNWLYRVIFNYYKQSQGVGEHIGNILQGFTSSSYMTLNLRAGIANVLVGDTNIISEAFANEYFGKEWFVAKRLWGHGVIDYIHHAYDNKADTKVGAIIKGLQIVDYSELNGRITQLGMKKWSQVVNDLGFSINNAGEHMMQNSAMIAMALSHKVLENPNYGEVGEPEYIVVNFAEFTQNVREQILREIATPEQREAYDKFVANIKRDPNKAKNFAWYREEPVAKFIADNFSKEQRKQFKSSVETRKKEIKEEFKNAKSVYDQLDINEEGYMCFAKGSIFESLNTIEEKQEIPEAYRLLGEFKGRVIAVNKKIHGNYGKLDSAAIEKFYLGRLLMQYHKHIPVGILKRYRREGYFNEERGTVEKGMYTSLADFLTFPVKAMRDRGEINDDEAKALISLQNMFNGIIDYFKYLAVYRDIMPDYDRANLRRMLGTCVGMLFAVAGAVAIKVAWDDDNEDSIAYNLLIYEMDRLASEAFMWNPYGAFSEAKKQWSSPIAAMSIVSDCMKIMGTITGIIFEREDYDPYYYTGRYAGRHKLGVYFERRIPYYRNYAAIRDIADNNHFYKIGDNVLTWIPVEDIANAIKGKH